jgi:2-polyprenyl-6-hydroxyphenyl methylase/3-demethylubiquinone-9 3-methyltransferase
MSEQDARTFTRLGGAWWNRRGEMYPLHHLNPCRVQYVAEQICQHLQRDGGAIQDAVALYFRDLQGTPPPARQFPNAGFVGKDASVGVCACYGTELERIGIDYGSSHGRPLLERSIRSWSHLPLQGLRLLDVGCGGGILSEPLAYLGSRCIVCGSLSPAPSHWACPVFSAPLPPPLPPCQEQLWLG